MSGNKSDTKIHGFFIADFPVNTSDALVKQVIAETLERLGAKNTKLYVGDDQPPPQPPIPPR